MYLKNTGLVICVLLEYSHYKNIENFQGERSSIKVIVNFTVLHLSSLEFGIILSESELKFSFVKLLLRKNRLIRIWRSCKQYKGYVREDWQHLSGSFRS